ncbi:hypothetical protein LJB42_000731 [Komagataella kurtzmanii]|nr:hypothetical protein LJB42_000731 [Komagataella kurtzmanii]
MFAEKKRIPGTNVLKIEPVAQRRLNSCLSCRSRKRKCDKSRPECSQCKGHGRQCSYYKSNSNSGQKPVIVQEATKIGAEVPTTGPPRNLQAAFWPFVPNHSDSSNPCSREGPIFTNIMSASLYRSVGNPQTNIEALRHFMPTKEKADKLLSQFLKAVHPIVPVMDLEAVATLYVAFWENRVEPTLDTYITLFSILYAGSVSMYEEANMAEDQVESTEYLVGEMRKYVSATEVALAMSHFPRKATFTSLQGAVILHSICRNDCKADDSGSIAMLLRIGHLLELHRDPEHYHKLEDFKEIQRRRLLWWHILYLDGLTSLSSGLLPLMSSNEYDTEYPSEDSSTGELDQIMVFCNCKFRWIECCNDVMRNFFGIHKPTTLGTEKVNLTLSDLNEYCQQQIQKVGKAEDLMKSSQLSFSKVAISIMSTFADRCHMLLYKKLSENTFVSIADDLETERTKKVPETSSLGGSISGNVSNEFTQCAIHFLNEFCFYGKMPENKQFLWEIRKFQPLQAILALLRSLIYDGEQVCSMQQPDSQFHSKFLLPLDERVVAIERALNNLGYLSEHTTRLCKERWETVRILKERAFRLLFFDVNVNESEWTLSSSPLNDNDPISENLNSISFQELPSIDWDTIEHEMKDIRSSLEEAIAIKIWDQDSGHFLL